MVISTITLRIYFLVHFIPKENRQKHFYVLMSVCDVS